MEASEEKKQEFATLLRTLREMYIHLLVNPGKECDTVAWCSVMKNSMGEAINVYEQEVSEW